MERPYEKLPENLRESVKNYIENGKVVGSFLNAVLCNDLLHTMSKCDKENLKILPELMEWIYMYAPAICWRNWIAVTGWQKKGGLNGISRSE